MFSIARFKKKGTCGKKTVGNSFFAVIWMTYVSFRTTLAYLIPLLIVLCLTSSEPASAQSPAQQNMAPLDMVIGEESPDRWEQLRPAVLLLTDKIDAVTKLCKDRCSFELPDRMKTSNPMIHDSFFVVADSTRKSLSGFELKCENTICSIKADSHFTIDNKLLKSVGNREKWAFSHAPGPVGEVELIELTEKSEVTVMGTILSKLRICMDDDKVEPLTENRIRILLNIRHPEGFDHLLRADLQVYFQGVENGKPQYPPRVKGWFSSWKTYDDVQGLIAGFPENQRDFKKFRTEVTKCLEDFWL